MANSFRKGILNFMKLNDDSDYDEEYDEEYEDDEEDEQERSSFGFFKRGSSRNEEDEEVEEDYEEEKKPLFGLGGSKSSKSNVIDMKNRGKKMEVCVIKAAKFDDSKKIVDNLLASKTVVLNLENVSFDVAQRLIDFTYGACYAINGNFQKASECIFVAAPKNVDVSGAISEIENEDSIDFNSL